MMPFAEGATTTLFLVGLVLMVGAMLFRAQLRSRRRDEPLRVPRAARPERPQARTQQSAPGDWQVQMHELAREMSGRIDTKLALLERLIRDARQESTRLEDLLRDAARAGLAASETPWPSPERGVSSGNQAEALSAALSERTQPASKPVVERRYEEIYALADEGREAAAIAAQIGTPIGEVELILGLRERKGF